MKLNKKNIRKIGDVDIIVATKIQAILSIKDAVRRRKPSVWGFCNAHTVNLARQEPYFASLLKKFKLFNDGFGLDIASKILYGKGFIENLNGTDLTPLILQHVHSGTRVFLLGSAPGVPDVAARNLSQQFPGIKIVGTQHGFFSPLERGGIIQRLMATKADLVIVGMGQPTQELWAAEYVDVLQIPILCVGAFIDFSAGKINRAPRIFRQFRFEWAYRLMLEPRRLGSRYLLGNLSFLLAVIHQRLVNVGSAS